MQNEKRQQNTARRKLRSRVLWFLLFLVLAALTLRAITHGPGDFSFGQLIGLLRGASPLWIAAACLCMVGFVLFEALSLRQLTSFLGCKRSLWRNTIYSAADVYFSAITPSATGGQPASAMFMMRDGIPGAVTTMCLLLNVMLYTVSILVIGILCFLFYPGAFFAFRTPARVLILLGFSVQILLVGGLLLLVLRETVILRLSNAVLTLLHKLHLIRNVDARRESMHRMAEEYRSCIRTFRNGKGVVFRVFLLNLAQRICNISVTLCIYLAVGGTPSLAREILVTQGFVVLGASPVPIPGAVGVSDFLFLDGFHDLIPDTVCVELLSRGISFYLCLLCCGLLVLGATIADAIRKRRASAKKQGS